MILAIGALSHLGYGQRYQFRQYSMRDGLLQSQIGFMGEDPKGYMWIGHLAGGIARFDGLNFTGYDYSDNKIGLGAVVDGAFDSQGHLWVQTTTGLFEFDGQAFSPYPLEQSYPLPTGLGKLDVFAPDSMFVFTPSPGILSMVLTDQDTLLIDSLPKGFEQHIAINIVKYPASGSSNLVVTGGGGFFHYQAGEFSPCPIPSPPLSGGINDVRVDSRGILWAAGISGVHYWDGTQWHDMFEEYRIPPPKSAIRIAEQQNGALWFSSLAGAYRYWDSTLVHFGKLEGLTDNQIMGLYGDRENNMWFWTQGEGMFTLKGNRFRYILAADGLESNVVMGLRPYQDRVFIGTYGNGIYTYSPENGIEGNFSAESNDLPSNQILTGYTAKNGDLIFGFRAGGFSRYNGTRWDNSNYDPQLGPSLTITFAEDQKGNLWVGDLGKGLYRFHGSSYERISTRDGLPSNTVRTVYYHETDSSLWVGTNKGTVRYKDGVVSKLPFTDSLADYTLFGVSTRPDGTVWMSLLWGGIASWDGTTLRHFTTADGLTSNVTYLHEWDTAGNLYLGTEKGLDRVVFSDQGTISDVRHYGYDDGFLGIETNGKTSWKDSLGRLWIGTVDGVMILDPQYDKLNTNAPKTLITAVEMNYEPVDWAARNIEIDAWSGMPVHEPEFDYTENNLTFRFIGISLANPENVAYGYRLTGHDVRWSPIVDYNQVTYSNLKPGAYTFQVRARNRDGFWSTEPTEFTFHILTPWWQTTWFLASSVLVALMLIAGVIHLRTYRLRKAKTDLELKVRNRTEEIMAQKEEIEAQRDMIEQKNQDITDSLRYAQSIQRAILPQQTKIKHTLPEHFIFYQPVDIVSGDFYWYAEQEGRYYLAAVDCTGHGVPGAFMSLIASQHLNQIVIEEQISDPAKILNELNERVRATLHQKNGQKDSRDGLDIALLAYEPTKHFVAFAGAKRPLYYINNGSLEEIKGDRRFIGSGLHTQENSGFTTHEIALKAPTTFYLTSDGFADQFGGPRDRKFMSSKLKETLFSVSSLPIHQQKAALRQTLDSWMVGYPQTDDILVMGVRLGQ